jgi:hypothetical protein
MPAHGKTMPIALETMTQARLHNAFTTLYLQGEAMNVGMHFLINIEQMSCHDCTQQNTAETRRWVGG